MELLSNWREEKRSAYVYRKLSALENNPVHRKMFLELAQMAENQALLWEKKLHEQTVNVPTTYQPDLRTRLVLGLTRYLGARAMRSMLAAMKVRGMAVYHAEPESFEVETHHRPIKSTGNLRAAIFGMCDGLLSNASLIFGIAGAGVSQHFIVLSGMAGLLAGAFSMGTGEYISVRSQRQMLEYQLELEREELELYPSEEAAELAIIYEARGIPREEARALSTAIIKNPKQALNTLAREELGIRPEDMVSPWGAAFSSFFSFALGAAVPLLPFCWNMSHYNLYVSIGLTGLMFFLLGAVLSLFTQRNAMWGGVRMLLIGAGIGVITNSIGRLLG